MQTHWFSRTEAIVFGTESNSLLHHKLAAVDDVDALGQCWERFRGVRTGYDSAIKVVHIRSSLQGGIGGRFILNLFNASGQVVGKVIDAVGKHVEATYFLPSQHTIVNHQVVNHHVGRRIARSIAKIEVRTATDEVYVAIEVDLRLLADGLSILGT